MKEKVKNALNTGYIRVFRTLRDWQWYSDIPCKVLYLHCLLVANHTTKKWQTMTIKKGSFLTSVLKLSNDTGLSVQQVRTALKKLKSTNEITYKTTNKNTVVEVCNYSLWQDTEMKNNKEINKVNNNQITNNQQTNNKQITTTNNENNIEREYRENFEILIKFAELKKAKNPVAYADKIMQSPNLDEVIKNCKIEIENAKKLEEKKKKIEQEKIEEKMKIEQGCRVAEFSDEEIIKILQDFYEKKPVFKSPIIKNCEKEAEKRGLRICQNH